jgi:thymidylate synthase
MKYTHEDGTPFSKEEFLQKLKTDKEFNEEFGSKGIDQIANLINDLKTNPDSRRLMVNAWNVGELNQMVLPPCHYGFQVYTRELTYSERYKIWFSNNYETGMEYHEPNIPNFDDSYYEPTPTRAISLMWNQRSVDTFLGLPFNIASYGLLLEIIAKEVNMVPDELIGNLGDVHLYENHLTQAGQQITREPYQLPKLIIDQFDETNHYIGDIDDISEYNIEQFKLENYQSHPSIKAPLSN